MLHALANHVFPPPSLYVMMPSISKRRWRRRRQSISADLVSVEFLHATTFWRGKSLVEEPRELLYQGKAPGLMFWVSYVVERGGEDSAFAEVSTVVTYVSWSGRAYFFFVRPVHRLLLPWYWRHAFRRRDSSRRAPPIALLVQTNREPNLALGVLHARAKGVADHLTPGVRLTALGSWERNQ